VVKLLGGNPNDAFSIKDIYENLGIGTQNKGVSQADLETTLD
jgi:hypothetical protein